MQIPEIPNCCKDLEQCCTDLQYIFSCCPYGLAIVGVLSFLVFVLFILWRINACRLRRCGWPNCQPKATSPFHCPLTADQDVQGKALAEMQHSFSQLATIHQKALDQHFTQSNALVQQTLAAIRDIVDKLKKEVPKQQ